MKRITLPTYTASQFRGAMLLIAILTIIGFSSAIAKHYLVPDLSELNYTPPSYSFKSKLLPTDLCVDVNLADSTALDALPGIGPVLAMRIIRFRDSKGGFDSISELKKVYGLKPETFTGLENAIFIGTLPNRRNLHSQKKRKWEKRSYKKEKKKNHTPLNIELNSASALELQALPGIGPVLSKRIVKYRDALNGFRDIDQMGNVYGLPDSTFQLIKPLLWLDSTMVAPLEKEVSGPPSREKRPLVDLNEADSLTLVSVSGIGAKLAPRIIKLRKKLGYFHTLEQLKEVWGLREDNFERISTQLIINENLTQYPRLLINRVGENELKKHPYLNWKEARILVSYREFHGDYNNLEEMKEVDGISPATLDLLSPYIQY